MINPGEFNNRIVINELLPSVDDEGYEKNEKDKDTNQITKCWAKCTELNSSLQLQAINSKLENTVLFTVRYCKKLNDLDSEKYKNKLEVVWRGRRYKVYLVDMHNYNKEFITFKCLEVI